MSFAADALPKLGFAGQILAITSKTTGRNVKILYATSAVLSVLLVVGCGGTDDSSSVTSVGVARGSLTGAMGKLAAPEANSPTARTPLLIQQINQPSSRSVTLNWTAPDQNTDTSALTNLAGFNIYYGTDPNAFTNHISISDASTLTYVVAGLHSGTWYFAITSVNNGGVESSNAGPIEISL